MGAWGYLPVAMVSVLRTALFCAKVGAIPGSIPRPRPFGAAYLLYQNGKWAKPAGWALGGGWEALGAGELELGRTELVR